MKNFVFVLAAGIFSSTISVSFGQTFDEGMQQVRQKKVEICTKVAKLGVEFVHERQTEPNFQLMFDELHASFSDGVGGASTETLLFLLELVRRHPMLTDQKSVERWQSEVYLRGFDFCVDAFGL